MELLNFWLLVIWVSYPSLISRPISFASAAQLTCRLFITLAIAEGRHENQHHNHHHHHHGQWWTLKLSVSFYLDLLAPPSLSGSMSFFHRTLAAVLHCFWSFVWRHSHLPLLLLLILLSCSQDENPSSVSLWPATSISFLWGFVCSAIELMISVCIAHFMHNFRKFSLRFCKRKFSVSPAASWLEIFSSLQTFFHITAFK